MLGCEHDVVQELYHIDPVDVERHGRIVVEVLAPALGALEMHMQGGGVVHLEPVGVLDALALIVDLPVVELLVHAAQELRAG